MHEADHPFYNMIHNIAGVAISAIYPFLDLARKGFWSDLHILNQDCRFLSEVVDLRNCPAGEDFERERS